MAWHLLDAKPLSQPMLEYSQLELLGNKLQWSFNRNLNIFIQENAFENVVCEIMAIFVSTSMC